MTAAAADALRMLAPDTPEQWPARILAAADIRQTRAEAVLRISKSPWKAHGIMVSGPNFTDGHSRMVAETVYPEEAEHVAAEGSPAHALAAVRHWRGTVGRHRPIDGWQKPESACFGCRFNGPWTNCPELTEVADEARAYLGGLS